MPPTICPVPYALLIWPWHSSHSVRTSTPPPLWISMVYVTTLTNRVGWKWHLRQGHKKVTHFHLVFLKNALWGNYLPCQKPNILKWQLWESPNWPAWRNSMTTDKERNKPPATISLPLHKRLQIWAASEPFLNSWYTESLLSVCSILWSTGHSSS